MWIDLFNFVHNSLGMHFWELAALIVGVLLLVEIIVHSLNQKRREGQFDKERKEKLETLQSR